MVRIPTLFPDSAWETFWEMLRGPVLILLYRTLLLVGFVMVVLVAVAGGGIIGLVATIVAFSVLAPLLRDSVRDIWNADFAEVELDTDRLPWR